MRRLRFCHLTTFYPPYSMGGDAIFVQRLARMLVAAGHHVEVVHCLDSYRLLARDARPPTEEPDDGVVVHRLSSPLGALSPILTHATGYPLLKQARLKSILAEGFEVLNFHNISLLGGPMVTALGSGLKLYTAHEYWHHCPTHVLLKWGKNPCQVKHCWPCSLYQKRPPQLWRHFGLMEKGLSEIDLFLYATSLARDLHHKSKLPGQVEVLPHFAPGPLTRQEDSPRQGFLYVGRLVEIKGLLELLQLFADRPQHSLTVVGDGPLRGRAESIARKHHNIHVLGAKEPHDLSRLYRQTRAVLIPSKSHEIGPLVMMEALAHATPVVVSAMGDMPRVMERSQAGLVATTEKEWQKALDYFEQHQDVVAEMGGRGRRFYEENYTPESYLESYLSLVDERL